MSLPNRVEDLRKRYHENPRRFFAPLANEYRKTGFIDRAILLCEKHLGEQPGNMNGLVVYGQCLFESGRADDARGPFEAALGVDPENLIALRHLGDIARLGGDHPTARRWYEKLLELDRRNEEVLAFLDEVGGRQEPEAPSGTASSDNLVSLAPSVSLASDDAHGFGDIDLNPPPVPTPAPVKARVSMATRAPDPSAKTVEVVSQKSPARRASLLDVSFDFGEIAAEEPRHAPPPAAPLLSAEAAEYGFAEPVVEPESAAMPAVESLVEQSPEPISLGGAAPIDGLELAEFTSDVPPLAELEAMEFHSEDVSPLAGLEPDSFSAGSAEPPPLEGLEPREFEAPAPEVVEARRPSLEEAETVEIDAASVRARFDAPSALPAPAAAEPLPLEAPEESPTPAPVTFVTETMARLYVTQGFTDRAIEVYRQLIAQSPDDEGLRARLRAIEAPARASLGFETPDEATLAAEAAPSATAMLSEMSFAEVALVTPAEPGRRSLATPVTVAPEPAGPSAREFFAMFARRSLTPSSTAVTSAPPTTAGSPPSALDGLFGAGTAVADERAAHQLAGVGATSGPSGGSALDSLFGEGPSAPAPGSGANSTTRAGVTRASASLSFDQFFEGTPADSPAPSVAPPAAEASTAAAEGDESSEASPEELPPDEDDLDQFQGWLRGLAQ